MYNINGWYPVIRCLCGREITLRRATVCECGVTMRFRRTPKLRGLNYQPLAVAPDNYDLASSPYKKPEAVGWEVVNYADIAA